MWNELTGEQFLRAFGIDLSEFERRTSIGDIGGGKLDIGIVDERFDFRNDLAIGDRRIKIHRQFRNRPRDLATDGNVGDWVKCACGSNGLCHVAARHSGGLVLRAILIMPVPPPAKAGAHHSQHGDE